jgi:hypothetical protein
MQNQLSLFSPTPSPAAAVASLLATLAPLYTPAQVAAECCTTPFRARLIARVATAAGCPPMAAIAALRAAAILP